MPTDMLATVKVLDLPNFLRGQAAISTRPGSYMALNRCAEHVGTLVDTIEAVIRETYALEGAARVVQDRAQADALTAAAQSVRDAIERTLR